MTLPIIQFYHNREAPIRSRSFAWSTNATSDAVTAYLFNFGPSTNVYTASNSPYNLGLATTFSIAFPTTTTYYAITASSAGGISSASNELVAP